MTHAGAKEAGLTVAAVTGAGGSLGRAIARRLAAGGHALRAVRGPADAGRGLGRDHQHRVHHQHGGWANLASYVATKGAAAALARALARELDRGRADLR